ncbi:type VI secretion system protein ImpK [Paraburkholderia eburnea]|uniref:Type VI secretion system protein ImpK n=2 Tax=Paraburkholderia eburnea TaxID=1189126 RepID=A0A2S4MJX9_9BURK|nr:type VI secretion system protein ImpK [Paraburkholderia eburnea]PRZ24342.1 type VI secretion system protein ImpK [Paraburkholderia eburnea]
MRDLVHNTALLVTSVASGGTVRNPEQLRKRCGQNISQFADALAQRDYPEDIRREALLAQCALLDEMALRYLPTEARNAWEQRPMQVERFSIHDAGRRVIDSIEAHVREAAPDVELLEYYAAILGLGFVGRYALDGQAKRAALIASLHARLETLRQCVEEPFVTDRSGHRLSSSAGRFAPWIPVALAGLAAVAIWVMGSRAIDTQLVHIAPAKVVRS